MTTQLFSLGLGIGTKNGKGQWLEVFYPKPVLNPNTTLSNTLAEALDYKGGNDVFAISRPLLNKLEVDLRKAGENEQADIIQSFATTSQPVVITLLENDSNPSLVPEGYLKLQLLSHRLVKPHEINLNGLFGVLPNVAWTNKGAIDLDELPQKQLSARLKGEIIEVMSVDKFPKMTNYIVPTGVRIAHTARVRLGAYLGEGTTIMHEGFVNFNAGTAGPGMIEGRISAGVFVGEGSDLGGGCSTMGTLSGGNDVIISVGKECLIGANAGVGIPLGDRCTIEAGLYVTAGSVLTLFDDKGKAVEKVKARDLAGKSNLLFRRNSITGAIEAMSNQSAIELNEELHSNN